MEAQRYTALPGEKQPQLATSPVAWKLRNAEPHDARAIAEILAQAFPTLYQSTFGRYRHTDVESLLHELYAAGHLPLEDARLADIDGSVAAVMILHTGLPIGRGSAADYWRLIHRRFGFWPAPRIFFGGIMANLMLDRRIPRAPDLVYIEALAVAEPHRGKGLGSLLLADAEQWARLRGRSRLALHVLASNTAARRLYERTGFRPWHESLNRPRWQPTVPPPSWSAILLSRTLDRKTNVSSERLTSDVETTPNLRMSSGRSQEGTILPPLAGD